MTISVLELFTIGIGPSSSHSVGPMRAAARFVVKLADTGKLQECQRIEVRLYGSLALTGKGHGTDKAVLLGLEGENPETVDPDTIEDRINSIFARKKCRLSDEVEIPFDEQRDLLFLRKETLPLHPNGMRFTAFDSQGNKLLEYVCYSVGGGFVLDESEVSTEATSSKEPELRYSFTTGKELLQYAEQMQLPISEIVLLNETRWRSEEQTRFQLQKIWQAMKDCVQRGCHQEGILPGGLKVRRRAPAVFQALHADKTEERGSPMTALDWVNVFAMAVSEENAAGSRVVTAPTNGAAGVIPAVMHYYSRFVPEASEDGAIRFLLTAGAIGMLYKRNASISGAEVGCQGEIGVACSMAAGALTEVLGGTPRQVEMAAEIGMEHNLGLTCDPIGGLVQVPCIERCAMAAVKAINASTMALQSDGTHHVSLDRVIKTMRETGRDMLTKYKETSRGGLAVAFPEC